MVRGCVLGRGGWSDVISFASASNFQEYIPARVQDSECRGILDRKSYDSALTEVSLHRYRLAPKLSNFLSRTVLAKSLCQLMSIKTEGR